MAKGTLTATLRKLALGATMLALAAMAAPQAEARVEFRGGGTLYGFNGCEQYGWGGMNPINSRMRPAALPGNSENEMLTFTMPAGALFMQSRHGEFARRFRNIDHGAIWSTGSFYDGQGPNNRVPQMRLTERVPANITADTELVRISGIIRHFDGLRGCTARFSVVMSRR